MTVKLSEREQQAFDFIKSYIEENGEAPTRLEIAVGIGVNSKSHASTIVGKLRDKRIIEWDDYEPRSIRILEVKDEVLGDGLHQIPTRANRI